MLNENEEKRQLCIKKLFYSSLSLSIILIGIGILDILFTFDGHLAFGIILIITNGIFLVCLSLRHIFKKETECYSIIFLFMSSIAFLVGSTVVSFMFLDGGNYNIISPLQIFHFIFGSIVPLGFIILGSVSIYIECKKSCFEKADQAVENLENVVEGAPNLQQQDVLETIQEEGSPV